MLPDRLHLRRHIRYTHLNPCRAGLVRDPVEWEWSTHRDAIGATSDPWLDLKALNQLWNCPPRDFARVFHEYVSGDPTVSVGGTMLPILTPDLRVVATLERIEAAVLQSTRAPRAELRRRGSPHRTLALAIAERLGGRKIQELGEWLDMSRRSTYAHLERPVSEEQVRAVLLILANHLRFGLR
jgi:hypothetical protein